MKRFILLLVLCAFAFSCTEDHQVKRGRELYMKVLKVIEKQGDVGSLKIYEEKYEKIDNWKVSWWVTYGVSNGGHMEKETIFLQTNTLDKRVIINEQQYDEETIDDVLNKQ